MRSAFVVECFIQVPLLFSALYAKRPYHYIVLIGVWIKVLDLWAVDDDDTDDEDDDAKWDSRQLQSGISESDDGFESDPYINSGRWELGSTACKALNNKNTLQIIKH